jgi:uncharacterized membrane protein YdjX (TVP38/TMEM64 family)
VRRQGISQRRKPHMMRRAAQRSAASRGPWWLVAAVGLVLLLLCVGWFWIDALQSWLLGLGSSGVVIFVVILVLFTFLPAPDWPLPIAAGYVYGFWAFPLTYGSIAFASALAFLIARYLARDRIRALLARREKYRTFDRAIADEGWQVVVLLRLSPIVPFNLQNYALGVTAIPFLEYFAATLVGITPGIVIYVYFGIFGRGLESSPSILDWVLFGLGAVATAALAVLVTWKTKIKFAQVDSSRA